MPAKGVEIQVVGDRALADPVDNIAQGAADNGTEGGRLGPAGRARRPREEKRDDDQREASEQPRPGTSDVAEYPER